MAGGDLLDQGAKRVRLLTNNPKKVADLEAGGIEVVQRVPPFMRAILTRGAARPEAFSADDLETFVSQWSEPDRARACVALYRTFLTREFQELARGAYADQILLQPTVLLVGDRDPVIRAESLRGAEANAPHLEVRELPGVGHFVPEEAPEEALAAMIELYGS